MLSAIRTGGAFADSRARLPVNRTGTMGSH